ncbi:MAG TPA: hypothetical protein VE078_11185 [Thermoanaerobaculia bacterium]|nr:hypothetical protein [Thermoanaerobaculia bacterium]
MRPRTPTKRTPKPKAPKKPAKGRPTYRKGIDDNPTDTKPEPWGTPPPR